MKQGSFPLEPVAVWPGHDLVDVSPPEEESSYPIEPVAAVKQMEPPVPDNPTTDLDNPTGFAPSPPLDFELATAAPIIGSVQPPAAPTIQDRLPSRASSVCLDGAQVGEHHIAAASLIGASHASSGGTRQDAYDFVGIGSGVVVAVVADGLGSRAHSAVGARLFCDGVVRAALASAVGLPEPAELLATGSAHASSVASAVYGLDDRGIGFVGLVAVFGPDSTQLARVGDASAFRFDGDTTTEVFAAGDDPINLVGEALPGEIAAEVVETNPGLLTLVTDGLANDLRKSPAVRSWLVESLAVPRGPFALADALRYRRQGSHDDRTAVVVWRSAP